MTTPEGFSDQMRRTTTGSAMHARNIRQTVLTACILTALGASASLADPALAAPTETSRTALPAASTRPSPAKTLGDQATRVNEKALIDLSFQAPVNGVFGTSSVFKADVSQAPLAINSQQMVAHLTNQVTTRYGGIAAFNAYNYNTSFYTVGANVKRVDVKWNNCQNKSYTPNGLLGPGGQFSSVPIPAGAITAAGTDSELTIYQPSSDSMWDFWVAENRNGGWYACWGGRIDNVSRAGGWFTGNFGASASGLSQMGGSIGIREAQAGKINHAIALHIPRPAIWSNVSWPARRSDGMDTDPNAIPEGTRLRLDPGVDVSKLNLHPLARMIAVAAQKYGFIVTDKSGAVAVVTESGSPTMAVSGANPWDTALNGTPNYRMLQNFPWNKLQALPKNYGMPSGASTPSLRSTKLDTRR